MKIQLLLLTFLILSKSILGQGFAIAIDKNNFFYCGIENPITISVENMKTNPVKLETNNGVIIGSKSNYVYIPQHPGSSQIIIKQKRGNKYVEVGRNDYRIFVVPDPTPMVMPTQGHGRSFFKAPDYFRVELLNFDFDVRFDVNSFSFLIKKVDGIHTTEFVNQTALINEKIRTMIGSAIKGDTLVFDKIYVTGPTNITRRLKSYEYIIQH